MLKDKGGIMVAGGLAGSPLLMNSSLIDSLTAKAAPENGASQDMKGMVGVMRGFSIQLRFKSQGGKQKPSIKSFSTRLETAAELRRSR